MARYPSPEEMTEMYRNRNDAICALRKLVSIETSHLNELDRIGRFRVVDELWERCSVESRQMLRNDAHPHVRSAVQLADQKDSNLPAPEVRALMRKYRVTIRTLAIRMNITMKRVREVRERGVTGKCMCQDWREAITGVGFFSSGSTIIN